MDYFLFALVGFLVMVVFPIAFWWALSVAILKRTRASMAATIGVGLTGTALTAFAVWNLVELELVI